MTIPVFLAFSQLSSSWVHWPITLGLCFTWYLNHPFRGTGQLERKIVSTTTVATNSEPQSRYEDYFKLKTPEIQQMQKKSLLRAFLLSLKTSTSRKWGCHTFLLRDGFTSRKKMENKCIINPPSRGVPWSWRRWKYHSHLYKQTLSYTLIPVCSKIPFCLL